MRLKLSSLAVLLAVGVIGCRLIAGIDDIELESEAGPGDTGHDAKMDAPRDGVMVEEDAGGGTCACEGCTVLVEEQDLPLSLQISGDTLYWLNYGSGKGTASLMSMPKTGGTPKELVGNLSQAYGLQIDATHLYWASVTSAGDGIVEKVPLGGGTVVTLATGQEPPTSNFIDQGIPNVPSEQFLAVNDTTLYFVSFSNDGDQSAVLSVPLSGGTPSTFLANLPDDAGQNLIQAYGILLAGSDLFVLNISTPLTAILEASLSGAAVATAVPDLTYPLALTISGANILWCDDEVEFMNGFVRIAPIGGSAKTLGMGLPAPWGVVADAKNAYWINNGTPGGIEGSLEKAPLDGSSTAVMMVGDLLGPQALVQDATFLYWVDSSCGGVLRMPK